MICFLEEKKMIRIKDKFKWYWNVVRGLCIVLVIFIHVTIPLYLEGTVRWEWFILRRITAFPVAVFFFMAGYFVHFDKINKKQYLFSKIKRVLMPYFIFSTVYIVLNTLLGSNSNWKGIVACYLLGTSELHMYFCIYLIEMILLLPLLKKGIESKYRNVFILLVLLMDMAVAYVKVYLGMFKTILSPVCLTFLVYYVIGLYVKGYIDGRYKSKILDCVRKKNIWLIAGCVLVSLLVALIEGAGGYPNLQIGQVSIGNYAYCIAVIALFLRISWNYGGEDCPTNLKPIVWLGEQSFSIYLCHMVIMRPMIVWFENIKLEYPWYQLILFFGTLGCCIVTIVAKEVICNKYFVGGKEICLYLQEKH